METSTRVQVVDVACLHFHIRYESNYSLSSYGQIVGQTRLFNLGMATGQGGGNLFNSALKKIDLVSHRAHGGGVGKYKHKSKMNLSYQN